MRKIPQIMLLEGGRAETSVGVSVSLNWSAFILLSLHGNSRLRASVVVHGYMIFILSVKKKSIKEKTKLLKTNQKTTNSKTG